MFISKGLIIFIMFYQMEMEDPRKAGKLKEKALKESEKLKKNFKKIQQKADELILKEELELEQSIKRMQTEGKLQMILTIKFNLMIQNIIQNEQNVA